LTDSILIRPCREADLPAIQAIYTDAVLLGTASFELEAPTVAEMTRRRQAILDGGYPYLVAVEAGEDGEAGGRILGYAYASAYRARPAYRFSVENSVYVAPDAKRRGVGRALLEPLIAACETRGFRQMIAVIGDSANAASIGLHTSLGFRMIGTFEAAGFKFGRWIDSVLMQRALGEGAATLPK
jgi:phosphinothricin acetyltransferase